VQDRSKIFHKSICPVCKSPYNCLENYFKIIFFLKVYCIIKGLVMTGCIIKSLVIKKSLISVSLTNYKFKNKAAFWRECINS